MAGTAPEADQRVMVPSGELTYSVLDKYDINVYT
jgi:hypothetical protein